MDFVSAQKCPLVSVIVPVYNVERYLQGCIQSILEQNYTNIEVILVDDGSTDASWEICKRFADDLRVRCYRKNNGGVSSARNYGIEEVKGEYITFVDSDDRIRKDCIDRLLFPFINGNHDFCGRSNKMCVNMENYRSLDLSTMKKETIEYLSYGAYSTCACMYKKEILERYNLRFRENMTCSEDALFNREYFLYCNRLALIPNDIYFQNINLGSLSHKGHVHYAEYFVEKLKALDHLCDKMQLSKEEKCSFISTRAIHGIGVSLNHYILHWHGSDELKQLAKKSIDLLTPWISMPPQGNRTLRWWYFSHKVFISKRNAAALVRIMSFENKMKSMLRMVYKNLKR